MRVKIKGGTVNHSEQSLCETCRWSTIIRGARLGEQIVDCGKLFDRDTRVPFRVVSCSAHAERNQASLREMEETAWILRSDPHRNQVGFVRSSRLSDEERYVLEED